LKGTLVIITAVIALVVSFFLFTNITVFSRGYSRAKFFASDIIGPTLKVISSPVHLAGDVCDGYVNLIGVKKKNADLQKRLDVLTTENQKIPELEKENERLKSLLNLKEQKEHQMVAARVIGEDVANWFKCIIIDKGRAHGVSERMPVITASGVVGQAVEVSQWHSKVMILNDANSAVDVYVVGKHTRGIIGGCGQNAVKMQYVLKTDDVEVGDRLITSGKDAIYPKGLAVGIVININKNMPGLFADIDVMPFNNFKKLDEVMVVTR
jgi:rod shape-determining protein MreC